MNDSDYVRALCRLARLNELADAIVAADLPLPVVHRLVTTVTALQAQAIDCAPTLPDLSPLRQFGLPAPLEDAIRAHIGITGALSRTPSGGVS